MFKKIIRWIILGVKDWGCEIRSLFLHRTLPKYIVRKMSRIEKYGLWVGIYKSQKSDFE